MTKPSDVDDTVASAGRPAFDDRHMCTIREFLRKRERENVDFCTACKYCMPCPEGIDIHAVMGVIYEDRYLGFRRSAESRYRRLAVKAGVCTTCGQCETKCTQKLNISEEMAFAAGEYGKTEQS